MAILRKDRDKAVEASSRYEAIANDTTVVRLRHQLAAQKRAAKSEAKKANARVHVAGELRAGNSTAAGPCNSTGKEQAGKAGGVATEFATPCAGAYGGPTA